MDCNCNPPVCFSSFTVRLNDSLLLGNHHMENDGYSDKSEREVHEDWDPMANENGGRLTEESDMDQSDELSPGLQATAYVEQGQEEMAEVRSHYLSDSFQYTEPIFLPIICPLQTCLSGVFKINDSFSTAFSKEYVS